MATRSPFCKWLMYQDVFFFNLKGRSTAASYKEKKTGRYIVCDYIKKRKLIVLQYMHNQWRRTTENLGMAVL